MDNKSTKLLLVSYDLWFKLHTLKMKLGFKTINELVKDMLKYYQKDNCLNSRKNKERN